MMTPIKKTRFAKEIEGGEAFDCVFLVETIEQKTKKNGDPFWAIKLRDRTGEIDAKLWDKPAAEPPGPGEFAKVRCESSVYRDKVELTLKAIRRLNPDTETVDVGDFVPVGPHDRYEQMRGLTKLTARIIHPGLRAVCRHIVDDPQLHMAYRDAPAAKSMHHAYVGGLLDHALSLWDLACNVAKSYALTDLSLDLLLTAALWHDIGKTRELVWHPAIGYSTEGTLIGHVVIGLQMLDCMRPVYWSAVGNMVALPEAKNTWDHLLHIVASHHGRLEWGAAKTPMSREAQLFHLLDMIDSRMAAFDGLDEEKVDANGFGAWSRVVDGPFWRPQ